MPQRHRRVDEASPPVFFVDRSLGREDVANALRKAGCSGVEVHDDHYPINCPDEDWIVDVSRRGWAILTKDKGIRRKHAEQAALEQAGAAAFILASGDMSGAEMAQTFAASIEKMTRLIASHTRPLIVRVSKAGTMTVVRGERLGGVKRTDRP